MQSINQSKLGSVLSDILKNSPYKLIQFKEHISTLENNISVDQVKNKVFVTCYKRKKLIELKPEEVVRQLMLIKLVNDYGYLLDNIQVEQEITFGREKKRADIVIFDKEHPTSAYIIVEVKKPKLKDGKEQLKSYCNATGAPIGVWTNGESISYYHRKDPNYFEDINSIPNASQKLTDILTERWTIETLVKKDKLVNERKSLKDLILEMEDEVLANAGVDVFEEVFKLIFTKLYDEMESGRKKDRDLEFRNYGETDEQLKDKIQSLFGKAKDKWEGVFAKDDKIQLTPSHLSICISSLQDVKLFNSNLEVVDEAFEYLIGKASKGEKGQYFTPRYVIEMCVKMLNPNSEEKIIDTASGSCGFPVHTIFYVWKKILKQKGMAQSQLFTTEEKPAECTDYVKNNVFAIDFDEKTVRVGRTLNLIAGDGQTNVLHLNTLDFSRWDEKTKEEAWSDIYFEGWKKLKKLRKDQNSNRDFNFDIVMANPPFAGDIKEGEILSKYELAKKVSFKKQKNVAKNVSVIDSDLSFPDALNNPDSMFKQGNTYYKAQIKQATNVSRDVLFIERNLDFLKPGGRMAIVLPQGRFNNTSDQFIREYIADKCRILAVVGLHGNVFKPHTGTKTSVLFVQKWDENLCPRVDDYNIFFATMQEPSKDNSGDKIYVKQSFVSFLGKELDKTDFISKYGSFEECSFYIKSSDYDLHKESINNNSKNLEFLKSLSCIINGLKFSELTESEQAEYISIATPKEYEKPLLDSHGHLIVKHDLFNHDGLTKDGIAEAFIEFAKKEKLSFVNF